MLDYFFISIVCYYTYLMGEYVTHRISHVPHRYNILYFYHRKHHVNHYSYKQPIQKPPFRYDTYLGIPVSLIVHSPILASTYLFTYFFLHKYYLFIISEINLLLLLHDHVHSEIHINGSWLEKFKFLNFKRARERHILHHKYPKHNFALSCLDNTFDIIFGTFREP